MEEAGFKAHMNDLNAAIGLIQLGKLEAANAQRREIALQYAHAFADLDWFSPPVEKPNVCSAYHAYVARVTDRDGLIDHLAKQQIDASVYYKPNHLYSLYAAYRKPLPVTEAVWESLVTLPLFPSMTQEQVDQVVEAVRSFQPNGWASSA